MLGLAWPLVLTNLSWIVMGLVDTMMVGRVSAVAIGAVSLGGVVFFTVATFGVALLLGLDSLVPQAFGAGNLADCRRSNGSGTVSATKGAGPTRFGGGSLSVAAVDPSRVTSATGARSGMTVARSGSGIAWLVFG